MFAVDGAMSAAESVHCMLQTKHGPAHGAGDAAEQQHSRLLRIQKTVDDAKNAKDIIDSDGMRLSESVEVLSEIDNIKDVDKLIQIGQKLASTSRKDLQDFVRYSLLAKAQ